MKIRAIALILFFWFVAMTAIMFVGPAPREAATWVICLGLAGASGTAAIIALYYVITGHDPFQ